jgi:hypothetical protein
MNASRLAPHRGVAHLGFAALAAGLVALAACSEQSEPTSLQPTGLLSPDAGAATFSNGGEMGQLSVEARRDLAALRRLVAPLHDFDTAVEAGWDFPLTPCMESPEGGMGFHYANFDFMDGVARVLEPEALLFEPQKNGRLRFVAVEYIVPLEASADPPVLFGQEFGVVEEAGIWALHVWVGRHNPSGIFADWNPMVSCEHA